MTRTFRLIILAVVTFTCTLLSSTLSSAQALPLSPISGGVLAARAYRAGLLQPIVRPGSAGGDILNCSPAPCALPNVQASGDGAPVNEDPIATNLRNPNQLLTGGNDFSCPNTLGFYASNDGGSTWTHTCLAGTNGEGDPIVGYDLNNVAYAGGVENSSVYLSASTNNGQTWTTPRLVTGPTFGYLADKPWLEIDTNPSSPLKNALYVSVTQLDPNTDSQITVSHSTDGGKTWTTKNVAPMQTFPNDVDQFTDLAVGADGTVYVSWLRCPAVSGECAGQVSQLLLSKSTDGGNTWSSPITIATPTLAPDPCACAFWGALPNTSERITNIPVNAVFGKGNTAKVYVTFYSWSGSQMQVYLATSTNGGASFGVPVRVSNANHGDQFFPWVSLAANGAVAVTWLDRRNDPSNLMYQPWVAVSANGVSLSGSGPLSTTQSNPNDDGFGGFFMGDYRTHIFNGRKLFAAWMDMRTGTSRDEVGGVQF